MNIEPCNRCHSAERDDEKPDREEPRLFLVQHFEDLTFGSLIALPMGHDQRENGLPGELEQIIVAK